MLAAGLTPLEPYPGNRVPWSSKCDRCGRDVQPRYSDVKQGHGGCLTCVGHDVDLEIIMAQMASAGLEPLELYPGAREPWLCRHDKCGQEVKPRYNSVQQGRGGCLACAKKCVDLAIVMAAMSEAGLTPLVPYPGAVDVPWLCRHDKCDNEVRPTYHSVQGGGGGCWVCFRPGFNPDKPACVYLIETHNYSYLPHGVLKIGATGSRTRRLKQWQRRGWTLLEECHFGDGEIPLTIEAEVLKWINKDLGLEPCLSDDDLGGMGGSSETVSVAALIGAGVSVDDVRKKVTQLVKKASAQPVTAGTR